MTVTLYIEGGGDNRRLGAQFRECWTSFFVSFELLARVDPAFVEAACPHARALMDRLRGR